MPEKLNPDLDWARLEHWLDEIRRDLAEIRENTSKTAIAAATLTERVAAHIERLDIHHVPPCTILDKEVAALRSSHSKLLWAALAALAVSSAALLGALWDLLSNRPVTP